jgi:hypothetical protein
LLLLLLPSKRTGSWVLPDPATTRSHFTSSGLPPPSERRALSSGHKDNVALRYTSDELERHCVQWHGLSACPVVTVCDTVFMSLTVDTVPLSHLPSFCLSAFVSEHFIG